MKLDEDNILDCMQPNLIINPILGIFFNLKNFPKY